MLRFKPATAAYKKQIATLDLHTLSYIESLAAAIVFKIRHQSRLQDPIYRLKTLFQKYFFFFLKTLICSLTLYLHTVFQ